LLEGRAEQKKRAGVSYVVLYPTAIDGDYDKGVRAAAVGAVGAPILFTTSIRLIKAEI
jgi:hypothetical protein